MFLIAAKRKIFHFNSKSSEKQAERFTAGSYKYKEKWKFIDQEKQNL